MRFVLREAVKGNHELGFITGQTGDIVKPVMLRGCFARANGSNHVARGIPPENRE